jgi:hypothetical protein
MFLGVGLVSVLVLLFDLVVDLLVVLVFELVFDLVFGLVSVLVWVLVFVDLLLVAKVYSGIVTKSNAIIMLHVLSKNYYVVSYNDSLLF